MDEESRRINEDLNHIKNWLKKQYHLTIREEDRHLITFLRGCKFSLQRTKEKLDFFYSTRTFVPDFFNCRNPFLPDIQEILNVGAVLKLPQNKASSEPTTMLCRWEVCRYESVSFLNLEKVIFMSLDILMNEDDNIQTNGLRVVIDYKAFSLKYLLQFTPTACKQFLMCVQKAYPIRVKNFYCINAPPAFETIYIAGKPFMTEKFKRRLFVYTAENIDAFYKDIGQDVLPKEYGGDNASIIKLAADWKQKVEGYKEWFQKDSQYGSNEKLRPADSGVNPSAIFGMEGTFRKLNVD